MEVSKQFPMLKEQLLYKLEGIALHEERRLEETASVLALQVLDKDKYYDKNKWENNVTATWQASSINELAEEVLAATSLLPLETLLVTR